MILLYTAISIERCFGLFYFTEIAFFKKREAISKNLMNFGILLRQHFITLLSEKHITRYFEHEIENFDKHLPGKNLLYWENLYCNIYSAYCLEKCYENTGEERSTQKSLKKIQKYTNQFYTERCFHKHYTLSLIINITLQQSENISYFSKYIGSFTMYHLL